MNVKYNAVWKKLETFLIEYCLAYALVLPRVSAHLRVPLQTLSRTPQAGLYSYHIQRMQHLEPTGTVSRLASCSLNNADRQIIRNILPTDEVNLTSCGVKITEPPIIETIIIHMESSKVSTNIAFP